MVETSEGVGETETRGSRILRFTSLFKHSSHSSNDTATPGVGCSADCFLYIYEYFDAPPASVVDLDRLTYEESSPLFNSSCLV